MKAARLSAIRISDARLLSSRYLVKLRPTAPIPPAISHRGFAADEGGAAIYRNCA